LTSFTCKSCCLTLAVVVAVVVVVEVVVVLVVVAMGTGNCVYCTPPAKKITTYSCKSIANN